MSKKLNPQRERDVAIIDRLIRENFKQMVGVDIQDAVIDTKEMKSSYFQYVQRMANFFNNYTKLNKIESIKVMRDVEATYNITVER